MLLGACSPRLVFPRTRPAPPTASARYGPRSCFSSVAVASRLPGLPNLAGPGLLGDGLAGVIPALGWPCHILLLIRAQDESRDTICAHR